MASTVVKIRETENRMVGSRDWGQWEKEVFLVDSVSFLQNVEVVGDGGTIVRLCLTHLNCATEHKNS